ncbi:MAG TPA: PAS domain-containing protein [Ktedonobacteraceae bacterium]|nr:PAS domain-containing protein [Ktedonobacteraceae bacterium]
MQLEYILGHVSVGVAILDSTSLHIRDINPYMLALLGESWCHQDVRGYRVDEVVPEAVRKVALPCLHSVAETGQRVEYTEVPYEGFLEVRGRTYWRVSIERLPASELQGAHSLEALSLEEKPEYVLLVLIEDVTDTVRSRLHLNAIHYISSAIAAPTSLPLVLERILQALHEMVGSRRCAIFLIDHTVPSTEARISGYEEFQRTLPDQPRTATVAVHKGIHPTSQDWHPPINKRILLGRVVKEKRTLIITDTSTTPNIDLPFLDEDGLPYRPGSVLCVPIFEPRPTGGFSRTYNRPKEHTAAADTVLGTIEVYHYRARGFPAEEVKLLEQFAQQAGMAIQHVRLLSSIDRWARVARRNAHQKENVMQAIPDGVVIYDPRWRVADTNHAARQLFGWSDDVIGLPIFQALARSKAIFQSELAHIPASIAELEQRALSGQADEFKMIGADGQPYTMRCSYAPIRDDVGDIFAFILLYHDVTESVAARERIEAEVVARTAELAQRNQALQQAQAEQELSNARTALLLERLPSGVIQVSVEDATITIINYLATQLLQSMGATLEPLDDPEEARKNAIGKNIRQVLHSINLYNSSGALIPFEEQPLYKALIHGQASEAELHMTKSDGQTIYLLVNAAPLRGPDATITSAILVIQETTRIKALERAREDFFTTMAHELKTPLANIRAHLSALLARDLQWTSEEQFDFLQTADEQVERLVGMINHFLDASRVEAGALRLELEPIFIPELLEDLQDRLEALISSAHCGLDIVLPPQLPAVLGDYELIMSVLTNLLSNAFRYAPEGDSVQLAAEPVFAAQDHQITGVTLSVTDRGPGMSLEQQMAIFTRFSTFAAMSRPSVDRPGQPAVERRRRTSRWSPATGLGLYISRGIVEAHGSKLLLKSSPGKGAIFAFTLPVFVSPYPVMRS